MSPGTNSTVNTLWTPWLLKKLEINPACTLYWQEKVTPQFAFQNAQSASGRFGEEQGASLRVLHGSQTISFLPRFWGGKYKAPSAACTKVLATDGNAVISPQNCSEWDSNPHGIAPKGF